MPAVQNDPVMKATLEGWGHNQIVGASADTLASEMIVFKIRKPQKATRQRMTGTAAAMNEHAKITLAMGPRSQTFLESFKKFASEEMEWRLKVGPAPRGFNKREVMRLNRPAAV